MHPLFAFNLTDAGQATARAWVKAGCQTLDDVRARVQQYEASPENGANVGAYLELGLRVAHHEADLTLNGTW